MNYVAEKVIRYLIVMNEHSKIYIAGHRGMVGSAVKRRLENDGFKQLICRNHSELDLIDQAAVNYFFSQEKPEYVFLAAAKVGGIYANDTYPAEFLHINLQIQSNVIDAAYRNNVKKLMFLGSSCIYPRNCPQPIKEEYLMTGPLEKTNEWYAIAKIAGIKMCQAYRKQYSFNAISVMPTNLYGCGDNFDLQSSHVLPAMIRKFHEAKLNNLPVVEIWGTGIPHREFLYVDDMADACVYLMQNYNDSKILNIGTGKDMSIKELAELVKKISGYQGDLVFNANKPDGTPRKLLDISLLDSLGWHAQTSITEGIKKTYQWYCQKNSE